MYLQKASGSLLLPFQQWWDQLGEENSQELLKTLSNTVRGCESSIGGTTGLGSEPGTAWTPQESTFPSPAEPFSCPLRSSKDLNKRETAQLTRSYSREIFILCSAFISLSLISFQSLSPFLTPTGT